MPGGLIQWQARGAMDEFYTSANQISSFLKQFMKI